jgi:hypothetical protein
MDSVFRQQGAMITREAHAALRDLKILVDGAAEKIHAAELEAIGLAIGRWEHGDPLGGLRVVAETLRSPNFETAISEARVKTETAVAWHLRAQEQ